MTPELKAKLYRIVLEARPDAVEIRGVDLSDNGCGESPTIDIVFNTAEGSNYQNYHEIRSWDLEDFLEGLVK